MAAEAPRPPYERHVFICVTGPWCRRGGDVDTIRDTLKNGVKQAGLKDSVRINQSGCLNQCGHGPMIACYPENVWYSGVDADGATRILNEHVLAGTPVEAYRYVPDQPGMNKLPWVQAEDRKRKAAQQAP